MSNYKFKIGDRLKLKQTTRKDYAAKSGAKCVCTGFNQFIQVCWNKTDERVKYQMDGGYFEGDFELNEVITDWRGELNE